MRSANSRMKARVCARPVGKPYCNAVARLSDATHEGRQTRVASTLSPPKRCQNQPTAEDKAGVGDVAHRESNRNVAGSEDVNRDRGEGRESNQCSDCHSLKTHHYPELQLVSCVHFHFHRVVVSVSCKQQNRVVIIPLPKRFPNTPAGTRTRNLQMPNV